ncbi:MAG: mechanosensitive ion channel domain-containing protein [Pseudomonadota bacterium]
MWTNLMPEIQGLAVLVAAVLLGLLIHVVFWTVTARLARRTASILDDALLKHTRRPTRVLFPALCSYLMAPLLAPLLDARLFKLFEHSLSLLLILGVAWLLLALAAVLEEVLLQRFRTDVADNLQARSVQTQVRIIRRLLGVAVMVVALASILMSFERVRQLGAGLLASAGLAGLVIGLAAQRALANILAGIQIAFTQPIRLDDVVIVEGEWGWIEEITLTYVVVRIWDLRRLVLPISHFLEKPFQNWTRVTADILGTVYLYTDYSVPLDALRRELKRIVEKSDNWDGKVQSVVVTAAQERCMEVRALVSSSDSGKNWDLRCEVREGLLAFLQQDYPGSLPRVRAEMHDLRASAPGPSPAGA